MPTQARSALGLHWDYFYLITELKTLLSGTLKMLPEWHHCVSYYRVSHRWQIQSTSGKCNLRYMIPLFTIVALNMQEPLKTLTQNTMGSDMKSRVIDHSEFCVESWCANFKVAGKWTVEETGRKNQVESMNQPCSVLWVPVVSRWSWVVGRFFVQLERKAVELHDCSMETIEPRGTTPRLLMQTGQSREFHWSF